jgi:hypothetical protein
VNLTRYLYHYHIQPKGFISSASKGDRYLPIRDHNYGYLGYTPKHAKPLKLPIRLARACPRSRAALVEILVLVEVSFSQNYCFRLAQACLEQEDNLELDLSQRTREPRRHEHSMQIPTLRDAAVKQYRQDRSPVHFHRLR